MGLTVKMMMMLFLCILINNIDYLIGFSNQRFLAKKLFSNSLNQNDIEIETNEFVKVNNAVVVGGGPSGLSLAIGLYKLGWRNITVLEKREKERYPIQHS